MLNLFINFIASSAQLCQDKYKLQAVDQIWPQTLLMHPYVQKIFLYPTFRNLCSLDPRCQECTPLTEIQIACRGCQSSRAVNNPNDHSVLIHGAAVTNSAPLDLELVAVWPDGYKQSVQKMKVNFVDPFCEIWPFTDLENILLRTDVGSYKVVSKTIGPLPDSADICGGRVSSVIGRCLALGRQDNTDILSLTASDYEECLTPGIYQGSIVINFDRYNNGRSIINFSYALDCKPIMDLLGSDAAVHDYVPGGPDLKINLGTWTPQSDCVGAVSSNLKFLHENSQDWFKFDPNSQLLYVFGHPQIYEGQSFEFIYEALSNREVVASSVFRINFMKESKDLSIPSQANASKRRKLSEQVIINEFIRYYTSQCPSKNVFNPLQCTAIDSVISTIDSAGPFGEVSASGSQVNFNYSPDNLQGGTYNIDISCTCGTGILQQPIQVITHKACSLTYMINPPQQSDVLIDANFSPFTIPAFEDDVSGSGGSPFCQERICTSSSPNVDWNQSTQTFTVQELPTDRPSQQSVSLSCWLSYLPPVYSASPPITIIKFAPAYQSFGITIVPRDCTVNSMEWSQLLPNIIIKSPYVPFNYYAPTDAWSVANPSTPPFCGTRTCTNSPYSANIVWNQSGQYFTFQTNPSDVQGNTDTVNLSCWLTNWTALLPISQTTRLEFPWDCLTGNSMTIPYLPPLTIDQTSPQTTIPAFQDAISGATSPPKCKKTCSSDSTNVVFDYQTQLFTVKPLLTDVVGTQTVKLTCEITIEPSINASSTFQLTIQRCLLAQATTTGTPAVVEYYIADPPDGYPITMTFEPQACAAFYTFVPAIQADLGAVSSAFAAISTDYITITTADFYLAGTYNMRWWFTPTENSSQPPLYEYFVLNLKNPCLEDWSPPTLSPTLLVASILGPSVTSITTPFSPSRITSNPDLNCGLVKYETFPAKPGYLTINMAGNQITVLTNATDTVGTTLFELRSTIINWGKTVDVPFTVQINPCVLTDLTGTALISGSTDKKIFQAATPYMITTYTQTPACGYVPTYVLKATQQQPHVQPPVISPPFWLLSGNEVLLQSNDPSLDATQWLLELEVTIDTMWKNEQLTVTWLDPCTNTAFIDQTIADSFGFIMSPQSYVNVPLPSLNDAVNIQFGGSLSPSVCRMQSLVVTENGQTPLFINPTSFDTTSSQNVVNFSTTNALMAGPHNITVDYTLDLYPAVQSTVEFKFVFYLLVPPVAPATATYQVTSPALVIPISNFQVIPENPAMNITYTASLSSGAVLPAFIVFSEASLGPTVLRRFIVNTTNNSAVGTYQILVSVAFSLVPQPEVLQTLTFTLKVTAAPVLTTIQTNYAPLFTSPLGGPFEFQFGNSWSPTYKLPETLDPEGQAVTITVNYGTASSFLTYNLESNEFKMSPTTTQDIGNHNITVQLSDPVGKSTTYSFLLKILDKLVDQQNVSQTASNSTCSQQERNTITFVAYDFDAVTTKISYSQTDLLTLASYAAQQFSKTCETEVNGFDWNNALRSLLNPKLQKNALKYPDPEVSVSSITNTGKIKLSFSNKMYVPPLDQINNAAFPIATHSRMLKVVKKVRALQVRAVPGSSLSYKQNLTLSYNITDFQLRSMEIQLYFDNTLAVSSNEIPDLVEIKFPGNFYYFNMRGQVLAMNTQLKYRLPRQMPCNSATRAAAEVVAVAGVTTSCVMSANLALNIFLSASLQQLWSMVAIQQIVVLMPLWKVQLPGNAAMFYGFVMQIAAFDVVPTSDFYDKVLPDMPSTDPINKNFDAVGFSSMYFLYNSGSIMLSIIAVPLVAIVVGILRPCLRYRYPLYWYRRLKSYVFWNGTFQTITGTYTVLVMCVLINTKNLTFGTTGEIISSSFTILFGIILTIFPLAVVLWLRKNFERLEEPAMQQLLGSTYMGLDLRRGKSSLWQLAFYYARRALIPLTVVHNDYLIVQIITMVFFVIAQVILICYIKPFKGGLPANRLEIFNEVVLMLIMYTFMCFTDFVPQLETQYYVGYVSCGLVVFHLLVNLGIMSVSSFRVIRLRVQYMILKFRHKRAMKLKQKYQLKKNAVAVLKVPEITEDIIVTRQSRAQRKRTKMQQAIAEASQIDEVADEEIRDPYSIRRLERQFEEAKNLSHKATPSFANKSMVNARDEKFERDMDQVLRKQKKFQKFLDRRKKQHKEIASIQMGERHTHMREEIKQQEPEEFASLAMRRNEDQREKRNTDMWRRLVEVKPQYIQNADGSMTIIL